MVVARDVAVFLSGWVDGWFSVYKTVRTSLKRRPTEDFARTRARKRKGMGGGENEETTV